MRKEYDYLLVGAGLFNAVFAYQARRYGKRCLVIDKRPHVGGDLYCEDIEGIHVHRYGPHIFHTSNQQVWDFVNKLVSFNRFTLRTVANYHGRIYNLPFNMNTFHQMWGVVTPAKAKQKIKEQSGIIKGTPSNLEEQAISLVGRDIYEMLIKGYTEKQWGHPCTELPASIIKRLPVRFTYDNNYFNDLYQGVPEGGYNTLINKLFEGIEYKVNCNYFDDKHHFDELAGHIIYTGPIDAYFGYRLGRLEYRSLTFEDEIVHTDNYQGNAIVTYTDAKTPYTRIIEHKHFDINNTTVQSAPLTVITKETSLAVSHTEEPYYPVCNQQNTRLYQSYRLLAEREPKTTFGGRLATYQYMNMDETIANALSEFHIINKYNGIL